MLTSIKVHVLIRPGLHRHLYKERVWNSILSAAASAVCQTNDPTTPHPTDSMFCFRGAERHRHSGCKSSRRNSATDTVECDNQIDNFPNLVLHLKPIVLQLSIKTATKRDTNRKHGKDTRNPVCNHATLGRPPLRRVPRLV